MLIELNNVFNNDGEQLPLNHQMSLIDYDINGSCPFQSPVSIVGEVINKVGIVTLQATASFTFFGVCDRCADEFQKEFSIEIEHSLVSHLDNEDNGDFIVVPNSRLDLDELILTDILLELPTKLLCKNDCQGLCSMCGQNLNAGHCDCKKEVDPRLASLLQLLKE